MGCQNMGGSGNGGIQNGRFMKEHPTKMDDLVPLFQESKTWATMSLRVQPHQILIMVG